MSGGRVRSREPATHASHEPMDERGIIKLNGLCPYWKRSADQRPYCSYLGERDEIGLVEDQVKICGLNND